MRLPPKWVVEYTGRQKLVVADDTLSLPEDQQLGEVCRAQVLYLIGANVNTPLDDIFDPIVRAFVAIDRDERPALDDLWRRTWSAMELMPFAEFVEWFVDNGLALPGLQDRDKPFEYRTTRGTVLPRVSGADRWLASLNEAYNQLGPDERANRLAAMRGGSVFVEYTPVRQPTFAPHTELDL